MKARHHVTTFCHDPHLFAAIGPDLPPELIGGEWRYPAASFVAMSGTVLPGVARASVIPLGIGDVPESTLLDY